MTAKKIGLIIGIVLIVAGSATLTVWALQHNEKIAGGPQSMVPLFDQGTLDQLPKRQASTAHFDRLRDGLVPPTNSWISGLALQADPKAVFPMPYSFKALDGEFQIGLPKINSTAAEIVGGHVATTSVQVEAANTFKLTRFDKTSARLQYATDNTPLGSLTITQGSPYVFFRGEAETSLTMNLGSNGKRSQGSLQFQTGDNTVVVRVYDGAEISGSGATATLNVPKNGLVSWYILQSNQDDVLSEFAGNEITSVEPSYEMDGNQSLTKLAYKTKNNQPTVFAPLPYQSIRDGRALSTTYQSIYGDMKTYRGYDFTLTANRVEAKAELNVTKLSTAEKDQVIADLRRDAQSVAIPENDTYFAGKKLARLATLLSLAKQLGVEDVANSLQSTLKEELVKRTGKDYLYYDTELKGVAGQTSGFGSEDFNDHHFHYGYFIYAATILAKYDDAFVREHKDSINLLVADIASYGSGDTFPLYRHYDPYSGHSWAAGTAPFDDGNNQESSSEALNAWNATALWADVIDNKPLKQVSEWMLANETHTANVAWRSVDTSAAYLKNYTAPVASLSFGGKRTYATFFSNESNTKLAIQLIPMSPVMAVFSRDGEAINQKLQRQDKPNNYNVSLGDYLLMYKALDNKEQALNALTTQRDEFIDNGNSKAYIRAWIYANGR